MSDRATVVDANVLIYAEESADPRRYTIAQGVLGDLADRGAGVVTTQILAEYYAVMRSKARRARSPHDTLAGMQRIADAMTVLDMTPRVVFEAARAAERYHMHFYDAQLWASARLAGIDVILSEDFAAGTEIEGVRFLDPFAPGFSLEDALG